MNWALVLIIVWLALAVPVALVIGHAIHRSGDPRPGAKPTPPADVARPPTSSSPPQEPRATDPQPARRPRAR
jgi:hypothetical protein